MSASDNPSNTKAEGLTPAQQRTLDTIQLPIERRTKFPVGLADEIHSLLEKELAEVAALVDDSEQRDLWIAKRTLSEVFRCEASFMAGRDEPFEYNTPIARGALLHKAVEFWANSAKPSGPTADYVRLAIDYHIEEHHQRGDKLGLFLAELPEPELAALISDCSSHLLNFFDAFPPPKRSWKFGVEVPRQHHLCQGKVVLSGRFDLTLGGPGPVEEEGVAMAGRSILDLKTGTPSTQDAEDARYYALLETLVGGIPPMLVGSFYTQSQTAVVQEVAQSVLEAALRRTADGAKRYAQLVLAAQEPQRQAGPQCRWCSISSDCEPGQAWLAEN